jgi:hypothetical protein
MRMLRFIFMTSKLVGVASDLSSPLSSTERSTKDLLFRHLFSIRKDECFLSLESPASLKKPLVLLHGEVLPAFYTLDLYMSHLS